MSVCGIDFNLFFSNPLAKGQGGPMQGEEQRENAEEEKKASGQFDWWQHQSAWLEGCVRPRDQNAGLFVRQFARRGEVPLDEQRRIPQREEQSDGEPNAGEDGEFSFCCYFVSQFDVPVENSIFIWRCSVMLEIRAEDSPTQSSETKY